MLLASHMLFTSLLCSIAAARSLNGQIVQHPTRHAHTIQTRRTHPTLPKYICCYLAKPHSAVSVLARNPAAALQQQWCAWCRRFPLLHYILCAVIVLPPLRPANLGAGLVP